MQSEQDWTTRSNWVITPRRKFYITKNGKVLGQKYKQFNGYYFVGGFSVHRLVCFLFHGPPKRNQEVRHLDGNRKNNHPTNLCWGTRKENMLDAVKHGTHINQTFKGEGNPRSKLSNENVFDILGLNRSTDLSCREIGSLFGVQRDTIQGIVSGS